MAWKGFWHPLSGAWFDRVGDLEILLLDEIVIELTDSSQMAVNGFWFDLLGHEAIDIVCDRPGGDLLNRPVQPDEKQP